MVVKELANENVEFVACHVNLLTACNALWQTFDTVAIIMGEAM